MSDGVIVIGPECFADSEETVICWRGRNYYRPAGDGPPPRPERVVKAEALEEALVAITTAIPMIRTLIDSYQGLLDSTERDES